MLTNITLHGSLEQFGKEHQLNIDTPLEAIRALSALHPGFSAAILVGGVGIVAVDNDNLAAVDTDTGTLPLSGEHLHILPVPEGDIDQAIYWVAYAIMNALTAVGVSGAAATAIATTVATVVVSMAVSMAVSGIANMLWPAPALGGDEAPESKPSYAFDGPVNTLRQGNPVPLCYGGPLLVGSQVISASLVTEDLAL